MASVFYVLECTARGCDAEFLLNDIPVARRGDALGNYAAVQVNELVVDDWNEVAVVVNPGKTPREALAGDGGARQRVTMTDASVKVRLARYPRGAAVGGPKGVELAKVEWRVAGEQKVVCPRVETVRANLGQVLGRWSFQDAPRVAEDTKALAELNAFLAKIRDDLHRGDPESFIAKSRVRLEEIAAAYELEDGEKEHLIRTTTADDSARDGWGLEPLVAAEFSLRACARGRLIEIVGKDWKPVLKEKPAPDGSRGLYDMFVARVDGAWHIVR